MRCRVGMLVALSAVVVAVPTVVAADVVSVVTVEAEPVGPLVQRGCNDIGEPRDWAFTFTRAGDTAEPLVVQYATAGTALPGTHYTPLTGEVTIPAGAASTTVVPEMLVGDLSTQVELTITLVGTVDYQVGDPASATGWPIFLRDPALPELLCPFVVFPFHFSGRVGEPYRRADGAAFRIFAVRAGQPSVAEFADGLRQLGGELPPGVTVGADGIVSGTATVLGTYVSRWEICLPDALRPLYEPPHCRTFDVLMHVFDIPRVTVDASAFGPFVVEECNDVGTSFGTRFTFTRDVDFARDLYVAYDVSGTAISGVHYVPLSGTVVIRAGDASATVEPLMSTRSRTKLFDLTVAVRDTNDYDVGAPGAATALVVTPRDPLLGPYVCGWRVAPESTEHDIEVGDVPASLVAQEGGEAVFGQWGARPAVWRVLGGALPPGVELADDGSFTGAATTSGTYVATVEACHPSATDPPACATADVTIEVHLAVDVGTEDDDAARGGVLPRTGATSLPALALVGFVVLLAGAALMGAGRRRAA